jgi:phosphohistidine swiveling domain-containing protein
MTDRDADRLHELLQGREWVKGAVNYDEDLHFSTFYLRASCAQHTAPLYPGYSAIVAFYLGWNETYYLLKSECLATATAIVRKALRRPAWLPGILAEIHRRSDLLARTFPPETSAARLARLSDAALLVLLRRHASRQRSLYRVARLPEALDRGVSYFSRYLMEHLSNRGTPSAEVGDVFATLTQPQTASVLSQEMLAFDQIVQDVRAAPAAAEQIASAGGRGRLVLDPAVLRRLDAHREKWQFLTYHGYGRREVATPGQYLERLAEQLRQPRARDGAAGLRKRLEQGREARKRLLDRLNLDDGHRRLFEVYPEIGAAKLYRRYAQLRNFYYLDLLLAEIARRLGVTEWALRCMLPEEIEDVLEARRPVPAAVEERLSGCLYALIEGREQVVGGTPALELARRFQEKTRACPAGKVLTGVVASQGKVTGPCKVLIRADDVRDDFARGAIVVSESTDPDLLRYLERAGGVLTEQGGVTSHAAVICRELGVPTIIGIEGLLDRVRDGDVVEVDAFRGTVALVEGEPGPGSNGAAPSPAASPDVIGAKAYNLGVVRSLGFHVPAFVVLDFDEVRRLVDGPADPEGLRRVERAVARLGLAPGERLALRSSSVGEDRESGSLAGEFRSLLRVRGDGLAEAFRAFVEGNRRGQRGGRYGGALIVQRMIEAEYAGVCLTRDPRTGRGDAVVLELAAGDNEAITGGRAAPDRLVVDRLTGDILEAERRCPRLREAALDVAALVRQFLTLEARFGGPLDVEWAWADRKLYILQARPIVNGNGRAHVSRPRET